MKRRRSLVIALLLVAALALGIGYAAISDVLVVDGTITVNEQPFQLVYVSYEHQLDESGDGVTSYVQGTIADNTTAKLNVSGFSHVDDKMVGVFTVENKNDVTLYVGNEPVVKCGDSATNLSDTLCNNFDCQIAWAADGFDVHTDGIPAGGTATFTITLTLTRIPDALAQGDAESYSHYFRIDIPATSVEP